ncbi:hypothetical protein PAAG_05535 [Paracoccidioides lutzii Pb01]|uniref:Uncharacterized protein n=1 Tax=Paracoccidioides lutzii (strain ATCC MYA-826 / Pb01) TaxID=502779 RepID=C1H442_PARBA|nr:hypothetical protein PAAG_05535 [Paracoccidioides lutzii Pb01]EEH34486.2 hypothetical protein PAAG_05535 [Paracoccidioides lutzii Pb01]
MVVLRAVHPTAGETEHDRAFEPRGLDLQAQIAGYQEVSTPFDLQRDGSDSRCRICGDPVNNMIPGSTYCSLSQAIL